jgi:hypothetical protein
MCDTLPESFSLDPWLTDKYAVMITEKDCSVSYPIKIQTTSVLILPGLQNGIAIHVTRRGHTSQNEGSMQVCPRHCTHDSHLYSQQEARP